MFKRILAMSVCVIAIYGVMLYYLAQTHIDGFIFIGSAVEGAYRLQQ